MSNENLPTKGVSTSDLIEKRSRQILECRLPLGEALFIFYPDKTPNLDGHIEFLDDHGSTTTKLFFQLKGTEQDTNYYDCDIEFINYCYRSAEPVFLILVTIPQEKVYWEHIDQAYIVDRLGIKDIANFNQNSKRVIFLEEKQINQNASSLIEICKRHYQDGAKLLYEQAISITQKQIVAPRGQAQSFDEIKKKFSASIKDLEEKLMLYYAFVYALTPYFLDQRGEKRRRIVLRYLSITDSEERLIIENLMNAKLLGRVGDLIFVTAKEEAISVFNHFIDMGRIDLGEIAELFY